MERWEKNKNSKKEKSIPACLLFYNFIYLFLFLFVYNLKVYLVGMRELGAFRFSPDTSNHLIISITRYVSNIHGFI